MARYIITTLIVLFAAGTTAHAAQGNLETTDDVPTNSTPTQSSISAETDKPTAADAQATPARKSPTFWDKTGSAIANTGNAAMDMGGKALDSASKTASKVGDKAVDVGHSAMDTTSDVITTVSDSVTGALGMDSKKAADGPAADTPNGNDDPQRTPQAQTTPQPERDQN